MQLNRAMMNDQRQNDRDRELFSELIEPPIHPKQSSLHDSNERWSSLEMQRVLLDAW